MTLAVTTPRLRIVEAVPPSPLSPNRPQVLARRPGLRGFLVIDRMPMIRQGVGLALQSGFPGSVAHRCDDLPEALRTAPLFGPVDLILLDDGMMGADANATITRLRRGFPAAAIIITASQAVAAQARACFAAGVRGYVLKSDPPAVLEHLVALLMEGEGQVPIPAWLLGHTTAATARAEGEMAEVGELPAERLTARQRAVFDLIKAGASNKEIARSLGVLEGTVKVHVRTMMQKLGVTNRTQIAVMAARGVGHRGALA